jgi:UDP-N-acetylglucosamine 2-epimerase (non-hydrolysing)
MMSERHTLFLVAGARPNFMKIAPLWRALQQYADSLRPVVVHTGQHYDYSMSQVFFEDLEIPRPDFYLDVGSGSHASQTAEVMCRFEKLIDRQRPDLVVVVGDVNSTLAAALVASKMHIPIAHVEAGLRSFDRSMPEEVNRLLTDRISTLLFVTEPAGRDNLVREGIDPEGVHLVGNVMVDELAHNLERIRARRAAADLDLPAGRYGLATIHRPANVDNEKSLRAVLEVLREATDRGVVVFPVHPRTAKNIESFGLGSEFDSLRNLKRIEPRGYLDFMNLVASAAYVLTDSGGIQVESCWLGVPCITLRPHTEHLITLELGCNRLTDPEPSAVSDALAWASSFDASGYSAPSIWDGKAAERIARLLSEFVERV